MKLPSLKDVLKALIDELNRFLIILFLIFLVISFFVRNFYIDITKVIILGLIIFRLASKNKIQRRKENEVFKNILSTLKKPFDILKRNYEDRNKYVYKKCSKCKTTLKLPLPNKRGINHSKCPNCGNRVTIITFRKKKEEKIKVDVIKKKTKY